MRFPSWSQVLRRLMQLSGFAGLIWLAFGRVWRNYKLGYNHPRLVGLVEGEHWAQAYTVNEKFFALFGEPLDASTGFLGLHWSSSFFGLESVDPTLAMAQVAATGTISMGLAVAALVPIVLAVFAGRFFCSHICPARLLFEVGELVRRALKRRSVLVGDFAPESDLRPFILIGGLVASAVGGSVLWLFILPYVAIGASIYLLVTTQAASVLLVSVVVWLLVDILVAPGYFCRSLCPTGWVLRTLGRYRLFALRTVSNPEPCPQNCRACERVCPYNISSRDAAVDLDCDSCGRCVAACPAKRLKRGIGAPLSAALMLFMVLSAPMSASAHHNKGLPHYGYYDNYPQVPVEEFIIIDGRWEMGAVMFNFQGYDSRETSDTPDDVKLYMYIYDLEKDQNYVDDADFYIKDEDGVVVAEYLRLRVDEEAVYSTRERLPRSGDYTVVARLATNPPQEVSLPIHVELRDGPNYALMIGIGAPVLLLFGLAFAGRSRRRRT